MAGIVRLDRFTLVLYKRRPDAPQLDPADAAALQDQHLAFLADLHASGTLQAAGPVRGEPGNPLVGLCILPVEPDEARRLMEQDPGVQAGRDSIETVLWMVPSGAIDFSETRFPRSIKDVTG